MRLREDRRVDDLSIGKALSSPPRLLPDVVMVMVMVKTMKTITLVTASSRLLVAITMSCKPGSTGMGPCTCVEFFLISVFLFVFMKRGTVKMQWIHHQ